MLENIYDNIQAQNKVKGNPNSIVVRSPNTLDDAIDILYDFIAKSEQRVDVIQGKTGKPTTNRIRL